MLETNVLLRQKTSDLLKICFVLNFVFFTQYLMFSLEVFALLQMLHFMHRINQIALDPYQAMNHRWASGPDPKGHAFIGDHVITEQSAERL